MHFLRFQGYVIEKGVTIEICRGQINSAVDPNSRLALFFDFSRISLITKYHKNTNPGNITIFT